MGNSLAFRRGGLFKEIALKEDENGYKVYSSRRNGRTYYKIVAPTGELLGNISGSEARDTLIETHLKKQEGKDRPCMRCRKTFRSSWIGNRLCKTCGLISEGMV